MIIKLNVIMERYVIILNRLVSLPREDCVILLNCPIVVLDLHYELRFCAQCKTHII